MWKRLSERYSRTVRVILWLGMMILVLTCVGLSTHSSGSTSSGQRFWTESPKEAQPVLPNGFTPMPSLSGLVHSLKPAVVNVYTTQVIKPFVQSGGRGGTRQNRFDDFFQGQDPFGQGNPFEHFFPFFGGPEGEFKSKSLGSGFIISPDGYILTNHHVVANATEIKIKLADDQTYDAKVIGSDKRTDLALLKVDAKNKLPTVSLGDSDKLDVGDWVVAIGNPFGLGHTVTAGIVSGKGREIGQGPYDDFLQTDASINPGNSGGPLFDTSGNVVGINSAIIAGGSGIGFAVPINMAKTILNQLHDSGKVTRGWLGVGIQELTDELAGHFGIDGKKGVLVSQVFEDGPAAKAGIKAGDIVLAVDGVATTEPKQLSTKVASLPPGHDTKIQLIRDGHPLSISVKLTEREAGESLALGEENEEARPGSVEKEVDLGLTVVPLTRDKARSLGLADQLKGLVVVEIDRSSSAAGMIQPGDVILEVNHRPVATVAQFEQAVKTGAKGKVLFRIQRKNSQLFLAISQ